GRNFIKPGGAARAVSELSEEDLKKTEADAGCRGIPDAGPGSRAAQVADAHADQAHRALERYAAERLEGRLADGAGVARRRGERHVARHRPEVGVTQLHADRAARVSARAQVLGDLRAQPGERPGDLAALARVALEGGLAAARLRLAEGHDRALVAAVRALVQPAPVARAEALDQIGEGPPRELAESADAELRELRLALGPDAVQAPHGERPDARLEVGLGEHGKAVGLVELGADLREQLVRRDRDRAREPGRAQHAVLDRASQRRRVAGQLGEIDIGLVDAVVLHDRRHLADRRLEQARDAAVLVEVDRQEHALRAKLVRGAHRHRRADAVGARDVVRGGDDAAARRVAAPADRDRLLAQLGPAQQLHR